MVLPVAELPGQNQGSLLTTKGDTRDRARASKKAADVFRQYGLGPTGFWKSVAVPPPDDEIRPGAKLKNAFEELGGVYVIFARFLLWRADLLSVEYLNALRQVNYGFAPVSRDKVIGLLDRELGALSDGLIEQLELEPVWSTLTRTAYLSWFKGTLVVVQVARERIPEGDLQAFEAGLKYLGHADVCHIATPRVLAEFREWVRQAETCALERSYLEVLAKNRGETLVDYPTLVEEITTDHVLCWPWIEGETVSSLIRRGSVDSVTQVAVAILEEFFTLSMLDTDLETDAMVISTSERRLVVRRINRPLSVPPPSVNIGMKYIAAVLEGNASMTVQTLLTLAVGRSTAGLESELLNLISGVEPELKVQQWYPGSAASFESNWRALARLEVSRPRPLYLDCLQRNLIAIGYWTSDAVSAGGIAVDTLANAHWPVVSSLVQKNASQFMDPSVLSEWSVGLGLLTFGAMREGNRWAEELREGDLTMEVERPDANPNIRITGSGHSGRGSRVAIVLAFLLTVLLVSLRWGSTLTGPAAGLMLTAAIIALIALFWVVSKIG
jgi:hypothetical protein